MPKLYKICTIPQLVLQRGLNMPDKMTICYRCRHFKNLEPGSVRADVWYNHICMAVIRAHGINPVTGREEYKTVNDLGREVLVEERHPHCRDLNQGECPLFALAAEGATDG